MEDGVIPSDRMFPNTVDKVIKTWTNVAGVRTEATTSTTLKASVQPMRSARVAAYSILQGETGFTVYFPSDPGVKVSDELTWGTRTLSIISGARDEAGRGRVWACDCVERK
jgi:hypothetical protein